MKEAKSLKLNALLNGIRNIFLNLLFPLITFPYVSRVLAVDELGKYNFSSSFVSYFLLLATLGFDRYAVREGPKYRDDRNKIGEFASEVFSLNIVAMVISYCLLFGSIAISQKLHGYSMCILIFSLQIFFTTIGTEWLYLIYEEYTYITVRTICFKAVSILLLFIFVKNEGDYLKYAAVTVFASVGSFIINYFHSRKYCKLRVSFCFNWKKLIRPILIIFASNVATQIYVISDITMLGYMKSDTIVGIYSVSTKIYTIIRSVLSAALVVSIPRLAMYVGRDMQKEYGYLLKKISSSLFVFTIPAIAGLIMLRDNVLRIVAGEKYISASPSLAILSLAVIFAISSTLFNQCALLPYKREKYSLISSVVSAGLNIGLNLIFIPFLSETGAAISTLISEFAMALMNYLACKDIVKGSILCDKSIKNAISVLVGTGAIILVCLFFTEIIENIWIETFICVSVSAIMYCFILVIFKNPVLRSIFNFKKSIDLEP